MDDRKNRIHFIPKSELPACLPTDTAKSKVITLNFRKIKSWNDYARILEKELEFPRPIQGSPNRFLDWIRDLTWFDYEQYALVCLHFDRLAAKNFQDAYEIYDEWKKIILPFWEYEAPRCIVEGKTKDFQVYIVE